MEIFNAVIGFPSLGYVRQESISCEQPLFNLVSSFPGFFLFPPHSLAFFPFSFAIVLIQPLHCIALTYSQAIMVHLASVPNDDTTNVSLLPDKEKAKYELTSAEDGSAAVYGSRFAAEDIPRHEMPEREMPKEVAYRLIKDDLSLDGNPILNLASFVTTYMVDDETYSLVWPPLTVVVGRGGGEADE